MSDHSLRVGLSRDYATIRTENASFYYGYEHSICADCGETNSGEFCDDCEDADRYWCFCATFDGKEIIIPSNKLGGDSDYLKDMFNVSEGLMIGIGIIFTQYKITL